VGHSANNAPSETGAGGSRFHRVDGRGADGGVYSGNNGASCGEIFCVTFGSVTQIPEQSQL